MLPGSALSPQILSMFCEDSLHVTEQGSLCSIPHFRSLPNSQVGMVYHRQSCQREKAPRPTSLIISFQLFLLPSQSKEAKRYLCSLLFSRLELKCIGNSKASITFPLWWLEQLCSESLRSSPVCCFLPPMTTIVSGLSSLFLFGCFMDFVFLSFLLFYMLLNMCFLVSGREVLQFNCNLPF